MTPEERADAFIDFEMLKNWNCRKHLINVICAAELAARNDVLEEAAKVSVSHRGHQIAAAIRALKSKPTSKPSPASGE